MTLRIKLLQLSTGNDHPLASQPNLFALEYHVLVPPSLNIEIVGDKLVVLISFSFGAWDRRQPVQLFVWNWKTGKLYYVSPLFEPPSFDRIE